MTEMVQLVVTPCWAMANSAPVSHAVSYIFLSIFLSVFPDVV